MPLTLYWYILREILKLLATSLAVLVILLAFGAAIKPISEGMLGPVQVVKVIVYMIPGMLPFAMPFAAAFASTLVFFRMSQDNEITACATSGVSYREILLPILALGLGLTLGIFYLSNWVVPKFWRLVAQEIEKDVASVVVKRIQGGEVVEIGAWIIYADQAQDNVQIPPSPPGEPRPYNRIVFRGVAVGKLSRDRLLLDSHSAEMAVMDLYRDPDQNRTYATMRLSNVAVNDPDTGTLAITQTQNIAAQEIPSPFKQKPKFLSLQELKSLASNPQASAEVRAAKAQLVQSLSREMVVNAMLNQLAEHGHFELVNTRGQTYRITAPTSSRDSGDLHLAATSEQKVQVQLHIGDLVTQRLEADAARVEISVEALEQEPRINLVLERVQIHDPALPKPTSLREVTLPLLRFERETMTQLRSYTPASLIGLAEKHFEGVATVAKAAENMKEQVVELMREIDARLHERAAVAVNCVLVLLLGATMSMHLRQQVPLAIFFWCFMPTVVAFLTISSGEHMISSDDTSWWTGVSMAWAGNLGLVGLIGLVYMKLSRN